MCQARHCLPPGLLANGLMQLTTSHFTRLLLVLVSVVAVTFVKKRIGVGSSGQDQVWSRAGFVVEQTHSREAQLVRQLASFDRSGICKS